MAELLARGGTWTFDGDTLRIVPGRGRGVHQIRRALGERAVPLAAIAGIAYEAGRRGGWLRLSLREGADPVTQVAGGQLGDAADPYGVAVEADRAGVAEYLVDEVRSALLLAGPPEEPADRYLLPAPPVPLTATAGDGTVTFDGERIRLEWTWMVEDVKKNAGPRQITLADVEAVEWTPCLGLENGSLRFRVKGGTPGLPPKHDPNCLTWGIRREGGTTVLVAAAVAARLPHPSGRSATPPAVPAPEAVAPAGPPGAVADPDALVRRLRELGELHHDGILTDEEFAAAKRTLIYGPGA